MKKEKTYTEKNMDDAYDKGFKDGLNKQLDKMYNNNEVLKLLKAFECDFDHENIIRKGKIECWFNLYKK